ncbi:MAG: M12 family metallopeptidase [Myxococcota bacterium]
MNSDGEPAVVSAMFRGGVWKSCAGLGLASVGFVLGCEASDGRRLAPPGLADDERILAETDAQRAAIRLPDDQSVTVLFEDVDGVAVYNGDIELGESAILTAGFRAAAIRGRLWPAGEVRYFDAGLSAIKRETMLSAMAAWESKTTIRFVEISEDQRAAGGYVEVTETGDQCRSGWGYPGPSSSYKLRMGTYCTLEWTWMHELGHTIGLLHEQARSDRDEHIDVLWDNIAGGNTIAFDKYETRGIDGEDLGAYDYASIMHYDSTSFAKAGEYTLLRKGGQVIAPATGISAGDAAAVIAMYLDAPADAPTVEVGSCANRCNAEQLVDAGDGRECSCHPSCHTWKDCCEDFVAVCEDGQAGGGEDGGEAGGEAGGEDGGGTSMCAGQCASDQAQEGGCYCDALCVDNGDCCEGRAEACADPAGDGGMAPAGDPGMTCAGRCHEYSPSASCQCDGACGDNGDCCDDHASLCADASPPEAPSGPSCAGLCGTAASPDGECFCDAGCLEFMDCCGDYTATCG